jgi:hypothetical protein
MSIPNTTDVTVTLALTGRQLHILSTGLDVETRRLRAEVRKIEDRDGWPAASPPNCIEAARIDEHRGIGEVLQNALYDARKQIAKARQDARDLIKENASLDVKKGALGTVALGCAKCGPCSTFDRKTASRYMDEALAHLQGATLPTKLGRTLLDVIRHLHGDEVANRMPLGRPGPPPRRTR